MGAPVRGLEAVPVIANPLTLAVEWNPAGSRSLRAVREVKVVAHAIGAEPVVLELVTPSGAVFFRREAAASDAGLTLLVAGTVVEQRQLWGAWTVVARQGSRRTQVGFELER